MEQMPILIVWSVLAFIIIAYVIYRIATDKPENNKRHALYPFVSNPSDPTIPTSKLALFCYIFILAGISGVLLQLIQETGAISIAPLVLTSLQACIPIGVILFIILKVKHRAQKST